MKATQLKSLFTTIIIFFAGSISLAFTIIPNPFGNGSVTIYGPVTVYTRNILANDDVTMIFFIPVPNGSFQVLSNTQSNLAVCDASIDDSESQLSKECIELLEPAQKILSEHNTQKIQFSNQQTLEFLRN